MLWPWTCDSGLELGLDWTGLYCTLDFFTLGGTWTLTLDLNCTSTLNSGLWTWTLGWTCTLDIDFNFGF